jgi:site-specific recombinase XerC
MRPGCARHPARDRSGSTPGGLRLPLPLVDIVRKRDMVLQGLGSEEGQDGALATLIQAYLADLGLRRSETYARRVGKSLARLLAHLGPIPVRSLTRERVLAFRAKRVAAGASHRTVNLDTGALHTCLRWGLSQGLVGTNSLAGMKPLPSGEATHTEKDADR